MKRKAGEIIIELLPSVVREIYTDMRSLAHPEFTVFQFRVLSKLFVKPSSNTELAQWAGINKATMSRALTALQKKGLIAKKNNRGDRRSNCVVLTGQGEKKYKKIRKMVSDKISGKFEKIEQNKQKRLINGLDILREVFRK